MAVANVRPKSDIKNEMLTDLVAIHVGFGKLILNGASQDQSDKLEKPLHISDKNIPYLGYPLLSYAYWSLHDRKLTRKSKMVENLYRLCLCELSHFLNRYEKLYK